MQKTFCRIDELLHDLPEHERIGDKENAKKRMWTETKGWRKKIVGIYRICVFLHVLNDIWKMNENVM